VIIVVLGALVAFVTLRLALRRAPLPTMLGIGLLGLGFHTGVIALPAAVTAPVDRADARLKDWQQRQSTQLGCDIVQTNELLGSEGPRFFDGGAACPSVDP
jgi:hypothetical protein